MAKSQSKQNQHSRGKALRWSLTVFFITIVISALISLVSEEIMSQSGVFIAFVILFIIVMLGVVFDVIGVAVTSAMPTPFHSMAARKVPGAAEAIHLLNNADRVSSFCNDVIGDICGVVSGSASAAIAMRVATGFSFSASQVVTLAMSALVAGLTVGGKSVGKTFAINNCTEIVSKVGKLIFHLHHFSDLFQKNKSKR